MTKKFADETEKTPEETSDETPVESPEEQAIREAEEAAEAAAQASDEVTWDEVDLMGQEILALAYKYLGF